METYPKTLMELEAHFSSEESCKDFLVKLRWPDGFRCPRCNHDKAWPIGSTLFQCSDCLFRTTVIAGTIFQGTRIPLTIWFRAIWWVTSQKGGTSALGLKRILGLGCYQTAWTMLHKLRRAMIRPGRDRLSGKVEVDETYLGGLEEGVRGRQTEKKALIVIAAEKVGKKAIGRIRMKRIDDASSKSLHPFVKESIKPGSVLCTDGWDGYWGLDEAGYTHEATPLRGRKATEFLPRVHRVVSLLKRWLLGTHQGAVSHEHIDYYLDEFTFRFNRRTSRHPGKLFYRLLQHAVETKHIPYKEIVKQIRGPKSKNHKI